MTRTLRLVEIAELLGVSKQRAHQIAGELGFPASVRQGVRGRLWDRQEVTAWAKRWRAEKPWRIQNPLTETLRLVKPEHVNQHDGREVPHDLVREQTRVKRSGERIRHVGALHGVDTSLLAESSLIRQAVSNQVLGRTEGATWRSHPESSG